MADFSPNFQFIQAGRSEYDENWSDWQESDKKILAECFGIKNVSILQGAGCSSSIRAEDGKELGIPTMGPLSAEFWTILARMTKYFRRTRNVIYYRTHSEFHWIALNLKEISSV